MKNIKWIIKKYNELTLNELYEILQIRLDVFVIEQTCFYQDIDGVDDKSFHLMGLDIETNKIVAYSRIVNPGISYKEPSIGRVITVKSHRKLGLGRELMLEATEFTENEYKGQGIRISGQKYLEEFYNDLGFKTVSDIYLEDGIEHVEMFKKAPLDTKTK
jgi:ElaA protein